MYMHVLIQAKLIEVVNNLSDLSSATDIFSDIGGNNDSNDSVSNKRARNVEFSDTEDDDVQALIHVPHVNEIKKIDIHGHSTYLRTV